MQFQAVSEKRSGLVSHRENIIHKEVCGKDRSQWGLITVILVR